MTWLTPTVAVVLMYLGVLPSIVNVYLLWDDRKKPGVIWFILSMVTGGAWAFLYATFTLVPDPGVTLALANVFWAVVPTAAATMFLLAYEFVFKQTVSRRVVGVVFAPIFVLFALSWVNPDGLVFTAEYHVDASGVLQFPNFGGPVKVAVTKIYGYTLVFFGAGIFVGEYLRSEGIQRRQTLALLVVFSMLVLSTMVKVVGLIPAYFDLTSVVYSLSGVFFAHSINRHGLLKFVPAAREQAFRELTDAVIVVDPDGKVVDVNDAARQLPGSVAVGRHIETLITESDVDAGNHPADTVEIESEGRQRIFSMWSAPISYGRGLEGQIVVLSDITRLKERERELNLLKQIFSRVFRHNIRNDLNLVTGYAEFIEDRSEGEVAEWASDIRGLADKIVDQADKVRKIETVFTYDETVRQSLADEVRQVLEQFRAVPGVTIEADVADVAVDAHPRFDLAVQEVVDNAITHHDGPEPPEIEIYTELSETRVTLVVEDDGPGLPMDEFAVLEAEEETDLRHASGIGLWLVHWITARSDGELSANVTESGTEVRIHLPRAEGERDRPNARRT